VVWLPQPLYYVLVIAQKILRSKMDSLHQRRLRR
jgi:hypothetical protein